MEAAFRSYGADRTGRPGSRDPLATRSSLQQRGVIALLIGHPNDACNLGDTADASHGEHKDVTRKVNEPDKAYIAFQLGIK
jgi:hypothetical protein